MIKFIGDGGHAKVLQEINNLTWEQQLSNQLQDDLPYVEKWIIAVGDNEDRKKEAEAHKMRDFVTLIHPSAIIGSDVEIGKGTVIMAGVVVQPGCRIGKHVILNTSCSIDHDTIIEDFAHIAPGCNLCGGCFVGEGALMGVGSCAVPDAYINAWSIIKAGRVIE